MTNQTNDGPTNQNNRDALNWERVKVAEDEISELWKTTAKIETAEQAELAALGSQQDNFWPQIEAYANECDEILQDLGYPSAMQPVLHLGDGKWSELPPIEEFRKSGGQKVYGWWLAERYSQGFSDAWYAGRVGRECHLALLHFQKGDAGEPFLFSMIFQIASLRTDWRWRRGHKPSILTGRAVRKGAQQGAKMRAKKLNPSTTKVLEEMERLTNSMGSAKRAAELLAKNGIGTSAEANRKLWNRHKRK
jgi:hypothetical protein